MKVCELFFAHVPFHILSRRINDILGHIHFGLSRQPSNSICAICELDGTSVEPKEHLYEIFQRVTRPSEPRDFRKRHQPGFAAFYACEYLIFCLLCIHLLNCLIEFPTSVLLHFPQA